jgi:hypothetical protein
MTRINLIKAQYLADQHLIAEGSKEINQLSASFIKSLNSKKGIDIVKIPNRFTLNSGHCYFFYDKGLFLYNRFLHLREEIINRGFTVNNSFNNPWISYNRLDLYNDWEPTKEDIKLVVDRIIDRVILNPKKTKPDYWYRYKGVPISNNDYVNLLRQSYE